MGIYFGMSLSDYVWPVSISTRLLACIICGLTVSTDRWGLQYLKGLKTAGEIANWLSTFQNRVNNLAGSEFLELYRRGLGEQQQR
jgi:hypothetical protein